MILHIDSHMNCCDPPNAFMLKSLSYCLDRQLILTLLFFKVDFSLFFCSTIIRLFIDVVDFSFFFLLPSYVSFFCPQLPLWDVVLLFYFFLFYCCYCFCNCPQGARRTVVPLEYLKWTSSLLPLNFQLYKFCQPFFCQISVSSTCVTL